MAVTGRFLNAIKKRFLGIIKKRFNQKMMMVRNAKKLAVSARQKPRGGAIPSGVPFFKGE